MFVIIKCHDPVTPVLVLHSPVLVIHHHVAASEQDTMFIHVVINLHIDLHRFLIFTACLPKIQTLTRLGRTGRPGQFFRLGNQIIIVIANQSRITVSSVRTQLDDVHRLRARRIRGARRHEARQL